ncbi:MAG: hypothetical protein PHE86_02155 [Candidatus Marinimicrobia bacterium]|nr:hypothetical protein [Candidatus Neomarinimicrobiota bacterium]MDD5582263.1 hypothetical protein [Candidatus Neomarinimicrobiota bacterium]
MIMNKYNTLTHVMILIFLISPNLFAADADPQPYQMQKDVSAMESPIVESDWDWHKIGVLWNRITNFSYMGDDSYENRTPSCDYPGGTGNSYLYRGTIWLSAFVDGVFHSTQGDDHEFSSLAPVTMYTGSDAKKAEQESYTEYYDVKAPLATAHFPLGVKVIERTYAWSAEFAADFIIYEYDIINVGIDTDNNDYPDTPRDLDDFYFTIRFDGDVSKLPHWGAEYRFSNQDDHVISNGVSWDWIEKFDQMCGRDHGLTDSDIDSSLIIMFDGDNPLFDAFDGHPDDFGNPAEDGTLQTPGFLGLKVLKTEPKLKPHSFHTCHIYNDPGTDKETWDRMISDPTFEDILVEPSTGKPFPNDYRGILTFGPLEKFYAGDTIKVTTALSVGSNPDSGGVYSLVELVKNMRMAQFIVDNDFDLDVSALIPPAPNVEVQEVCDQDGEFQGVNILWDDTPESHENFAGYIVYKASEKTATGDFLWVTLDTFLVGSENWPPPLGKKARMYKLFDPNVKFGFDYYYTVQSVSIDIQDPPIGVQATSMRDPRAFYPISVATPVATETLDNVKVVPNPYVGSAIWNNPIPSSTNPWEHRLQFINLPADAKIKIFTIDGDFVKEIYAGETVRIGEGYPDARESVAEWDLLTRNDQEAAPGIYMYVVDSPSLGTKVGKFVIVR